MTETDPLKNFLFIDQLKIMGYGESDTSGCWIKFQLTPELLEDVRGRKGQIVEVAARMLDNSGEYIPPDGVARKIAAESKQIIDKAMPPPEPPKENHGQYWRGLISRGTFNAPDVLAAIGSEKDYKEWIQKQPSVLSGNSDWLEEIGEGRCEEAHVRRVGEGSGTGIKPIYFSVPLTHEEHTFQHKHGEVRALAKHGKKAWAKLDFQNKDVREWWEKRAIKYRTEWASTTLAQQLGAARRKECSPAKVAEWYQARGLQRFFPD